MTPLAQADQAAQATTMNLKSLMLLMFKLLSFLKLRLILSELILILYI